MIDNKKIFNSVIFIYAMCFIFRLFEYFVLRTDQSFLGEAVIHKIIGIGILFLGINKLKLKAKDVGFTNEKVFKNFFGGIIFAVIVFLVAYLAEIYVNIVQGEYKGLEFYVTRYTVTGNVGKEKAFLFFVICIIGNFINVIMEEGIFRGLFQKIIEKKNTFLVSAIIASILFGIWHVVAPIRSYFDGDISALGMMLNILMLVGTSSLVGFKFAMMTKLTGSLYMAMGDHFVNNTIVNILHIISTQGVDELMFIRISIAQSLSFIVVLIWYILKFYKYSAKE